MRTRNETPPDVLVALRAAGQKGQIATRELRAFGLDSAAVRRRVQDGRLHPVYRGVYSGAGALRAVIADGPAPTRSDLEDLVLDLLDAGGIQRPELNAPLRLEGITIIPDCIWRERRVAIEADSTRWHEHKLTREHDADKQAILEANGWRVLRVDWQQAMVRPQQTLARIRAALAAARGQGQRA